MSIFIITAIVFSMPTIYYRLKLKESEKKLNQHIESRWMWDDWGE